MASLGDESIDLSKLGTALFAFGFVLVIGLGIFTVGKKVTNDGAEKVQNQLQVIQQTEFEDYDQKVVLGTKVKSAYTTFAGKEYAILVTTSTMLAKEEGGIGLPINHANWDDIKKSVLIAQGGNQMTQEINGEDKDVWCLNYNAVLDDDSVYNENGDYIAPNGLKADDTTGNVLYFNTVANMSKQGTAEYVPSGAKYQANLIKDASGNVIGIVFIQLEQN